MQKSTLVALALISFTACSEAMLRPAESIDETPLESVNDTEPVPSVVTHEELYLAGLSSGQLMEPLAPSDNEVVPEVVDVAPDVRFVAKDKLAAFNAVTPEAEFAPETPSDATVAALEQFFTEAEQLAPEQRYARKLELLSN